MRPDLEIDRLRVENATLRDRLDFYESTVFGDVLQFPAHWRLTRSENRLLGVILSMNIAHRDAVMTALYRGASDEPGARVIDVMVFHLQRKLQPYNIAIRNLRGIGWAIDQPRRGQIKQALRLTEPPWHAPKTAPRAGHGVRGTTLPQAAE